MPAPRPTPPQDTQQDTLLAVLTASPSNVVVLDATGTVRFANRRALDLFGDPAGDLVGQDVDLLVAARIRQDHAELWSTHTTGSPAAVQGQRFETTAMRKDGSELPVEVILSSIQTDGEVAVIAAFIDVTERREFEADLRATNAAYLTLARMNEAIIRAVDREELFERACRVAVEQGGFIGAWIARPASGREIRFVARAGALDGYLARLRLTLDPERPEGRGPTATALRTGEHAYVGDFLGDDATRPWQDAAREYGIRASATVALRRGGSVVAALNLYAGRPHVFDDRMRDLLEAVADNISHALDGFDAADRLADAARERADLLGRLVAAQEEERARIAADVHDEPVQALAATDLRLGLLRRRIEERAPDLVDDVALIQAALARTTHGLREMLFELEPTEPGASLASVLRSSAEHVLGEAGVDWTLEADPTGPGGDELADAVRVQAVRIVTEALINIRKHAHASSVSVVVSTYDAGVRVVITDDGVGFDSRQPVNAPGHRGLTTMRDRAALVGGRLDVESRPGQTTVRVWLPAA